MTQDLAKNFAAAFKAAGGQSALTYCDLVRFIALMCVILAVLWSLYHFMTADARESEGFLAAMTTKIVRLVIGLTLFILFITT